MDDLDNLLALQLHVLLLSGQIDMTLVNFNCDYTLWMRPSIWLYSRFYM